MSPAQPLWDSTESTERPISLVLRLSNSGLALENAPSSVVQTGVKSFGWENRIPQLSPSHSWKLMVPSVVSAVKSGAVSPSRTAMCPPGIVNVCLRWSACSRPYRARGNCRHVWSYLWRPGRRGKKEPPTWGWPTLDVRTPRPPCENAIMSSGQPACATPAGSRRALRADTLVVEHDGPVTVVTINRPERRNAVDSVCADQLREAFVAFDADDDRSVAVLTGAGGHLLRRRRPQGGRRGRPAARSPTTGPGPWAPPA